MPSLSPSRPARSTPRWRRWGWARLSREGKMLFSAACGVAVLGVDVGRSDTHLLLLGALALCLASVLLSWAYPPRGLRARASAPRRVPVGEALRILVQVHNEGPHPHRDLRVEGPRLPWDAHWIGSPPALPSLDPGASASVELAVRFQRRGDRRLGPLSVASLVPLGLAQGAPVETDGLRVVVVPRPAPLLRLSALTRRKLQPGGVAQISRGGDAVELLGLRPYRPGDPIRDIHMRAWARIGSPVVREYQQESFPRVGVVLDTGRPRDLARFEAALSLAAGVIGKLCEGETLADVLLLGAEAHRLSPGRSPGSLELALDALAGAQPGPVFSCARALAALGPHLGRLSSVVLICLSWSDEHAALRRALLQRGAGCLVLALVDPAPAEPELIHVSFDALRRGEPLAL